jgi:hypothetical protein
LGMYERLLGVADERRCWIVRHTLTH